MIPEYKTVFDLLSDQKRWTTGQYARDKFDSAVTVYSPDACKFCLAGAISRIYGFRNFGEQDEARRKLQSMIGLKAITLFNDQSDHAEVLAVVKAAGI